MYYKHQAHQEAYEKLIEQMYLSQEEIKQPSSLLRKQLAFCYLIAMYQEDYEIYEGHQFYVEWGEELSIDGPTYLLEDKIGERRYNHEKILPVACQLLKGELSCLTMEIDEDQEAVQQAVRLCNGTEYFR